MLIVFTADSVGQPTRSSNPQHCCNCAPAACVAKSVVEISVADQRLTLEDITAVPVLLASRRPTQPATLCKAAAVSTMDSASSFSHSATRLLLCATLLMAFASTAFGSPVHAASRLQVGRQDSPVLGVATPSPELSWLTHHSERGQRQHAYRVVVLDVATSEVAWGACAVPRSCVLDPCCTHPRRCRLR